MHIHKPKVPHGVREFLAEISVIVVGIVIALGGEQVVEWMHWREVVGQTREALDHELAGDLGIIQSRIDQAPCMARRVSELKTAFQLHAKGQPLQLKGPIGQPQFPRIHTSVWETAIADQSASHMPLDVKLRYASLYDSLYWFRDRSNEESEAWSHLSQFDDQDVMTEQDWAALRQWKARAAAVSAKLDPNILPVAQNGGPGTTQRPFFGQAADLGVKPTAYHFQAGIQATRDAFCRPML
ncbi:hypothetical protein [Phenylobacterium montanum]|uniref:Uncharacterized protein n=1 Tax=Phenylobacterium montanum TaxID=2823693 RepID=A0A975G3X3_9CAUL|nr:hypothetical protein [Caulobacter sp. S6]QUD90057.1 hypothetical protein KCG34_09425 [Caulobacter sp. S6]